MQQPLSTRAPALAAPNFYLTGRQPIRPGAVLLAILTAIAALCTIVYAMDHTGHAHLNAGGTAAPRSAGAPSDPPQSGDDDDDPTKVDTIVLGDPADAPAPARKGNHVSPVHPTILVRLPRYGDQVGLIPDTPAGHLLYSWLAAFNQANETALSNLLPNVALTSATAAQMEIRHQTGGFSLLSAKEALPGVLVFRLRDQTTSAGETLGTLQMRPDSNPPAIASFSLRAVSPNPSPSQ
jgi:hypothetical protein